jgi:biotin carboxylase
MAPRDLRHPLERNPGPPAVKTDRAPTRLHVLFGKEWDRHALADMQARGEIALTYSGFDLFRFPANARLLAFDAPRFVDRFCARYGGRVDAVLSNNEQFGAVLAAAVTSKLGLPGNHAEAVLRAHHKLACRDAQRRVAPEAVPRYAPLGIALDDPRAADARAIAAAVDASGLDFPLFVKPVKATFSVLARRVDNARELAAHLTFSRFERLIIRKLVQPYADLARQLAPQLVQGARAATGMLLEEPVAGRQINIDGYVTHGKARFFGTVDAHMYPQEANGAFHFLRWAYPSAQPRAMLDEAFRLTRALLAELGYSHGFFNAEFFILPDGRLQFIEINPRAASQFADFYRWVNGLDVHRMQVALALGRDPEAVARVAPIAQVAASFVYRKFDGTSIEQLPSSEQLGWLAREYPQARLMTYAKRGNALAREYKWLGSHRYAVLNLCAEDEAKLFAAHDRISARLGWPAQR